MAYSFCQKALTRMSGQKVRSVYEPFIWQTDLFDRPYEECAGLFGKTSSVNITGIHSHLSIPLFTSDSLNPHVAESEFFQQFTPSESEKVQLFKIIRGNGRMGLFRALNPNARFLVFIRNPLACVNSVKYKFDYFGSDFYPSDLERFYSELNDAGKSTPGPAQAAWAENQAEYVYQMNAAAVEFSLTDPLTMLIEYDEFSGNKSRTSAAISEFLGWPDTQQYSKFFSQTIGPETSGIMLSEAEFESIASYATRHSELCSLFQGEPGNNEEQFLERFRGQCNGSDYDPAHDGLVPNALRRTIRQLQTEIDLMKNTRR